MMTSPQVMTMTDFKNRYFDQLAEDLREIKSAQKEQGNKLDKIHEQVTKTNGRVTTLEKWRDSLRVDSDFTWYKDKKVVTLLAIMGVLFMVAVVAAAGGDIPSWLAL